MGGLSLNNYFTIPVLQHRNTMKFFSSLLVIPLADDRSFGRKVRVVDNRLERRKQNINQKRGAGSGFTNCCNVFSSLWISRSSFLTCSRIFLTSGWSDINSDTRSDAGGRFFLSSAVELTARVPGNKRLEFIDVINGKLSAFMRMSYRGFAGQGDQSGYQDVLILQNRVPLALVIPFQAEPAPAMLPFRNGVRIDPYGLWNALRVFIRLTNLRFYAPCLQ